MSDVQHVRFGSKPDVCSTSAHGAQAAGALTGLPRELHAEYLAGDAKKKAAAGEHGSPWNTYYHAARSEGVRGRESSGSKLMRKSENGFKRFGAAMTFLWCMYFLNAQWLEPS